MKRLFHRRSSPNIKASGSEQDISPPLPTLTGGADDSAHYLTGAQKEMRRGMTLPALLVSPSSFSNEKISASRGIEQKPTDVQPDANSQPVKLPAAITVAAVSMEEKIWKSVNNREGSSKPEKILNTIEDQAGATASSSNNLVSMVKTVAANEEVKVLGNAVLKGIPVLMKTLEGLSKVHPFAAAAFLPFQFAYQQELKRRDNDRSRTSLFECIKDVMLVIVEMKGVGVQPDDKELTPDGEPVSTRLAALGEKMKKDIQECYNGLDALGKEKLLMKFFKASSWSNQLAKYKVTFTTRRKELQFALALNTAATTQEDHLMIKEMHDQFAKEFQAYKTPQDRMIEAWIKHHGGMDKVIADDAECAELIKFQNQLTVTHNIHSASGAVVKKYKGLESDGPDAQTKELTLQAVALRKELRTDITTVIQDNMESFQKRLELSFHLLREDIKGDIHQEGERMIKILKGGPHLRLKDKIMFQVWKDQGWRGSAKTRTLVLALRDYLVERVERSTTHLINDDEDPPSSPADQDDADDPETAMGTPLPDSWILEYLQVQRLRNIQQVLDPDTSGFSTIAEVNAFTRSRRSGWSLPRWISYWAIGWQIFATKYCTEIEYIFTQMLLIRDKVGIQMPGNKQHINNYIAQTWPIVTGLTGAIQRYEGTEWLANQFKDYIDDEETKLRFRLEKIRYDIDSSETVHVVVAGDPIERSIFMLIAVILRRHLAKMHLCLLEEMNEEELADDSSTIQSVVEAAWLRYIDLLAFYKHQQVVDMKQNFDWFSCGLFRNYFAWNDWTSEKYYSTTEIISSSHTQIQMIVPLKPEEIKGILIHEKDRTSSDATQQPSSDAVQAVNVSALTAAQLSEENSSLPILAAQNVVVSASQIVSFISGDWFGFHYLDAQTPCSFMFHLRLIASTQEEEGETTIALDGEGNRVDRVSRTVEGTVTTTADPGGRFSVQILQVCDRDEHGYHGVFDLDRQVISGTYESDIDADRTGTFIIKKAPTGTVMCHRPLVPRPDARSSWSFAIATVLTEIRRQKPSVAYIYRRLTMVKRLLVLMHAQVRCDGELTEMRALTRAFTVQEGAEIWKLYTWYGHVGDLQGALYCDACFATISRSRVLCLQCESKDGYSGSVEFHPKETCMSVTVSDVRSDLLIPHSTTHLLVKTRDALFIKDYPAVKRKAIKDLDLATQLYFTTTGVPMPVAAIELRMQSLMGNVGDMLHDVLSNTAPSPSPLLVSSNEDSADSTPKSDSEFDNSSDEKIMLSCLICHQKVSAPCWYCIDCKHRDTFVCAACETIIDDLYPWDYQKRYRNQVLESSAHNLLHLLIRIDTPTSEASSQVKLSADDNASVAAGAIELGHLHQVEQRLVRRMDEDANKIVALEQRLVRIEALLQALVPQSTNGAHNN
ncbi:hypothetical protein B0H17DRAFT_1331705 [Mycena rosella]|uniref:Uncharacterized protein n=1 Tax=Mycena rosella TaxID=1033263 RepID=A0AAD7DEH0_MYCRO|nr:hypothetical protein B0H17DRAFT_1331705 [Mycena rosella]